MRLIVVEHPLVAHKLTVLRDRDTDSMTFRMLVDELMELLCYEASRDVRVVPRPIQTPVSPMTGTAVADPTPVVVPILRAGLGLLNGMMKLLPMAEVGFVGMVRDEETLQATSYAERLPVNMAGRQVFLLDPMLATGGSMVAAIQLMIARGADQITAVCLLAAPEGLATLEKELDRLGLDATVVTASVDERLNEKGYIVPGLGDAGDRLYGTV